MWLRFGTTLSFLLFFFLYVVAYTSVSRSCKYMYSKMGRRFCTVFEIQNRIHGKEHDIASFAIGTCIEIEDGWEESCALEVIFLRKKKKTYLILNW